MNIIGIYNVTDTDDKNFFNHLQEAITDLQNDGQKVEVQYKIGTFPNGQIIYSALVLGRK